MKIRNNYVSNSSSCSFIVRNPNDCVQKLLYKLNMTKDELLAALDEYGNFDLKDITVCFFKDESSWDGENLNFAEFIDKYANESILGKSIVEFECDDYEDSKKNVLRLLYKVFANLGYDIDAKNSEHEFLYEDKTDLMAALRRISS